MKIEEDVKEINRENHRWWHFPWTSCKTNWYSGSFRPEKRVHTEYCTREGCGWERATTTIKSFEL